jgi:hypothetical protein
MIVHEVNGVHEIAVEALETRTAFAEPREGSSRFVRYLAKLDTTAIMVLDHERLLRTAAEPQAEVNQAALTRPEVRWRQGPEYGPARDGMPANPLETPPLFFHNASAWERELLLERARNLTSSREEPSATQQIPLAIVGLSG